MPSNEETALARVDTSLQAYMPEFTRVLAGRVDPEVFVGVAFEAARANRDLLEVAMQNPQSLMKALHDAAALALVPNGVLGSAYIVPRRNKNTGKKEAHFQIGYRGLVELARRSGQVRSVESRIVYTGEHFVIQFGTDPKIEHVPLIDSTGRGKIRGAYAVAFMRDGSKVIEYMTWDQVDAIRKRSAASSGPWVTDPEEMTRKTVIRRLCKSLPLSADVQKAIELDDVGDVAEPVTLEAAVEQAQPSTLADKIAASAAKNVTPEPDADRSIEAGDAGSGTDAQPVAAPEPVEKPARARRTAQKAAVPVEPTDDVPDDEAPAAAPLDVPQSQVIGTLPANVAVSAWKGTIVAGDKLHFMLDGEDGWRAKLLFGNGAVQTAIESIGDTMRVQIRGTLELVPWDNAPTKPPYRRITVHAIELIGGA